MTCRYSDGGAAAARALSAAAGGPAALPIPTNTTSGGAVHRWPFIGARAPRSSRDVVRLEFLAIVLYCVLNY